MRSKEEILQEVENLRLVEVIIVELVCDIRDDLMAHNAMIENIASQK